MRRCAAIVGQERARDAGDLDSFYLLDDAFHRDLCDLSGHLAVGAVSDRAKSHRNRVRRLSLSVPDSHAPEADSPRVKASPLARRMAAEQAVSLAELAGSGPGGRIVKADIESALASRSASTEKTLLSYPKEQPSASSPAQAGSRSSLETGEAPPAASSHSPPAGSFPAPKSEPEAAKGSVEVVELTKLQQTVLRRMADAAEFLARVRALLEEPLGLAL